MKSRPDPRFARTEFASFTGAPPYAKTPIRSRSGLKRTAFFPTIGPLATDYKLHNTYLKPDFITDPLEEYHAMRKVAGLWDVTGEEIIEIRGKDAEALLDDLMPRDVRKMKDGQAYYSVLCYDHGGIVEDGILVRFDRTLFWWIGGPGSSEEWLYTNAQGREVALASHNDRIHVASLQGPQSRAILQAVCDQDLSRVPFYGMFKGKVCGVPVTVTRTGYTAELGFDIYVDVEQGAQMFADLWDAVRKKGTVLCGSKALGIRRVEAAILNFGQDFDWQHTPVEIGLGWMISATKAPYRAQKALAAAKANPPQTRLAGLRIGGDEIPLLGDGVLAGGKRVGTVTSATGSPSLGYPIAIALIDGESHARIGTRLAVDLGGRTAEAEVVAMPFFDPERKLSKA
ncbi:MAG TPA: aminomethyltransferase family protein [Dongiaceae bacterium]|jgi:aminomethyltransferase|nr:aminomethyltransferase family protein [Dongiaceae bacterium]